MQETQTGNSPWRVTFESGSVVMIEIWPDETTYMTFGQKHHLAPCAACGALIETITETNSEQGLCPACRDKIMHGQL